MPYDALGNYIPGDEEPSLDQMRLALTHSQPSYTQIPTQGYPKAPQSDRPLDHVPNTFRDVTTKYNPLMVMKALREGVGATMVNPVVGGLQGVATELKSPEFYDTSRTKPTGIAEKVATDFMQRNAPTTPMAQEFTEGVGKLTQDLPAYLGHLSTSRPALTPNDVRVMGAEATRLGRQIRDIPTDFSNAQAGVQRIDPVTGQPTMGTKLQAGAESLGDLMERRRMQGLTPVPGVPETLQPQTSMYAVRPAGSRLALPQVPAELKGKKSMTSMQRNAAPYKVLDEIVSEELADKDLPAPSIERHIDAIRIAKNINAQPFADYVLKKAQAMYPDAPYPNDALQAWQARFDNANDLDAARLKLYDEFLQSPEGQASPMAVLPTSVQLQDRHKAAMAWLYGPWINYINKHVGASGDPAVKLASQGLTYLPADAIRETATEIEIDPLRKMRTKGGMSSEGEVAPAYAKKSEELAAAQADLDKWQTRREAYRDIARQQGLEDPAQLPDFANTTAPIRQLISQIAKLEEEKAALSLGVDFETLSDAAVTVKTQPGMMADIDYAQQQFYPSVTRARPEDLIYNVPGSGRLKRLGLDVMAKDVYKKVMSGEIPVEQLSKLSVDKLIHSVAEPRVKAEKAAAKQQAAWKATAENNMRQTMETYVPPENYFGNVGVLELGPNSGLSKEQLTRVLSEATTVLDHCIAQGGDAGGRRKNPWHPDHSVYYEPIYDVSTGQRNPKAKRDISSYAADVIDHGSMIADIRDKNTGLPVATLELGKSHVDQDGKQMYYVGWASGARNGKVNSKYQNAIKAYLNSRADVIASAGTNINRNLDIVDLQESGKSQIEHLADAGIRRGGASEVDLSGLPRFVTHKELKEYVDGVLDAQQSAPQATASQVPAQANGFNLQALSDDITSARADAIGLAASDYGPNTTRIVTNAITEGTRFLNGIRNEPATLSTALRDTITALETWRDDEAYTMRGTDFESAGDIVNEFIIDLEGILHSLGRGHYDVAPAEAQRVEAAQHQQFNADAFNRFVDSVRRDVGVDVADRIETVAIRIAENLTPGGSVSAALRNQPTAFAERLVEAAGRENNAQVEVTLQELADTIAPPIRDVNEPLPDFLGLTPDEGHPANQPTDFSQASENQLNRNIEPGRYPELNRMIDVGIEDARRVGVDAQEAYDAVRTGNVGTIQGTPAEMEFIARGIRDALTLTRRINIENMAFELFNDTRQGDDPNSPRNIEELRSTLYALENGNFDDARIRALPVNQRDQAQRSIAHAIRDIMDDVGVTLPAETQNLQQFAQQNPGALAAYDPIPDDVGNMTIGELRNVLTPGDLGEIAAAAEDILRFNTDPTELQTIADLVHNHRMSAWEHFNPGQRAMLSMRLHSAASELLGNQAPQLPIDLRNDADAALAEFEDAIDTEDAYGADRELARALLELQDGEDEIYGLWHAPERMTPALRVYLIQQLERLRRDLGGEAPDGHKRGGLIRGHQDGGSIKYPSAFSASGEALERSQELYPRAVGQDDQADAARHMLASGYMSQALHPTIAKGLGWLHEFKEAPIRTAGHALGLSNPRYDYEMDMHNNALGIEMAQKAKNRAEFEQMVKSAIAQGATTTTPGRVRLMTPDQAKEGRGKLKYANGGTVSQTPSLDAMKYELMMRSK